MDEATMEWIVRVFLMCGGAVNFWIALDTERFFRWFGRGPGPYPRWHILVFKVLCWVVAFGAIYELLTFRI